MRRTKLSALTGTFPKTTLATKSEADAAITAFFDEVSELRNRHRIPDVIVVAAAEHSGVPATRPDGDRTKPPGIVRTALLLTLGDERMWPGLASVAYHQCCLPKGDRDKALLRQASGETRSLTRSRS
jgi:hypothetical protein